MVNFTLEQFNSSVELDLCGNISQGYSVDVSYDAVAVLYAKTSDIKNVFMFSTNDNYLSDSSENEIRFYVFMTNWPDTVSLNPANAMMDQTLSENAISSVDSYGNIYDSTQMLVKHDFIRYLAQELFSSAFGVDLFSNNVDLLVNLTTICGNSYSSYALYQINEALNSVSTDEGTDENLLTDLSGYYYLRDAYDSTNNISRELYYQILKTEYDRFSDLENTSYPQPLPFKDGDTINYKITINAADNQHLLTGGTTSIPSRTYLIKLVLVSDSSSYSNTTSSYDSIVTYSEIAVTSTGGVTTTTDSNTILSFNGSTIKNIDITPFLDSSSAIFQNLISATSAGFLFNTNPFLNKSSSIESAINATVSTMKTTPAINDIKTAFAPAPAPAPAPSLSDRVTKFSELDELLGLAPAKPRYVPPPQPPVETVYINSPDVIFSVTDSSAIAAAPTLSVEEISREFSGYSAYFALDTDTLVNYIIVGGGGGGGGGSYGSKNNSNGGAGGGGGQIVTGTKMLYANTVYTVTIGSGGIGGTGGYGTGSAGTDGSNTSFSDITAYGGRGGQGGKANTNGLNYISGANGYVYSGTYYGAGGNAVCGGITYNSYARVGGDGLTFTYGNDYVVSLGAGGGGGGSDTAYTSGAIYGYGGSNGIGGTGAVAGSFEIAGSDPSANTGSGGGGGGSSAGKGLTYINGYNGADGCVIIWFDRYLVKDTTYTPKISVDDLSATAMSVKFYNYEPSTTTYNVSWSPNTPGAYVDNSSSDLVNIYDLSANTTYTITGTVSSNYGTSVEAYSIVSTPPLPPSLVITDACYTQIVVNFDGTPMDTTAYDLVWSPYTSGSVVNSRKKSTIKITGLSSNTTYSIYGYITTPQGTSEFSSTVTATTLVFSSYLGSFYVFGDVTDASIPLLWSGYYSNVELSYSTDNSTFTTLGQYVMNSITVDSLAANTTYYFSAVPLNDAGESGTAITTFYTTLSNLQYVNIVFSDVSAVLTFDGSFSSVDLSYNNAIQLSYSQGGSTGSDVSGLLPNYTYEIDVYTNNSSGTSTWGNTITFTTLPKIYSTTTFSVDSSSVQLVFDNSFASVNMYSSTTAGSYTSSLVNYTSSPVYLPGLQPNKKYYFKAVPVNTAGAFGYYVADISCVTRSILTKMTAQSVYDISARLVFDGSFSTVDICYNGVQLIYTKSGTTGTDISGLLPNCTYTVATSSTNFVGVSTTGNTVVFTTMPKISSCYTYVIDASTVGIVFDGSYTTMNIYTSSSAGTYSDGTLVNYGVNPTIITGLTYNSKTYFKAVPVGIYNALGYSITDLSGFTYSIVTAFTVTSVDSSSILLSWDGSFSSVNIYRSTTSGTYSGSATNYTSSTKKVLIPSLFSNYMYYFKAVPVGGDGKYGTSLADFYANTFPTITKMAVSAVYDTSATIVFEGSFNKVDICNNYLSFVYSRGGTTNTDISGLLPNYTYTFTSDAVNSLGLITRGNTMTFTTWPKMNYCNTAFLDSSSVSLTWDGSFASVNLYMSTTAGSYTGSATNYTSSTKSAIIKQLSANTKYYFRMIPVGTYSATGYMISDISRVTCSRLDVMAASAVWDTSAVIKFSGVYSFIDICYNDVYQTVNLKYYAASGTTTTDISGLLPNYTYTITTDSVNSDNFITRGNTITITTLPKVYSFTSTVIDLSTIAVIWDGSFASVNIYSSPTAGSYTGSATSVAFPTKTLHINGLNANQKYFFKIVPVGTYGALGYGWMDISNISLSKMTKMAASAVWDVSAVIAFDGSFSTVDICYNTVKLSYYKGGNTGYDISGLSPNTTYTITTDSINQNGFVSAGNTIVFTTLPKISTFKSVATDLSTVKLTWDGSFASVNVYTSTTRNTFTGDATSYASSIKSATITGINANALNYYRMYPVGTYGAIGYAYDVSAIYTTDFSSISVFAVNLMNLSNSTPVSITYFPKITQFTATAYDSSAITVAWDGSFSRVYLYTSMTAGTYSSYKEYSGKSVFLNSLIYNSRYYYQIIPIGEYGTAGYTITDLSCVTASYLTKMAIQSVWDSSAVVAFDGSFVSVDICYNDMYKNIKLTYYSRVGTTGLDISGLLPNYTYTVTTSTTNLAGVVTAGNTMSMTTLPKIYSYGISPVDSSSIALIWDGSFASVKIYASTTAGSYTGNAYTYSYPTKYAQINGLIANKWQYFRMIPVGSLGASGYMISDISTVTYASQTLMAVSGVYDTSAVISFKGLYSYIDICYNDYFNNMIHLTYYSQNGTTGTDISGLMPNYTYTVTTDSVSMSNLTTYGNTVTFTTLPKVMSFGVVPIDASSVGISWDGSYASVQIYTSTTAGSYTGNAYVYSSPAKYAQINNLNANLKHYFRIRPVGTYGAYGYMISDISAVTYAKQTLMAVSGVYDISARFIFDGSFSYVDICGNGFALKYYTKGTTNNDISGLIPNTTYTFTTDSVNSTGLITAGNTVIFTTLPKITTFVTVGIDTSTNYLTWDGSFASVNLYSSTTRNTFTGNAITFTSDTKSYTIDGLNANALNFYRLYPVGTYGAIGYAFDASAIYTTDFSFISTFAVNLMNLSNSTPITTTYFPSLTSYNAVAYDSSSATIYFDGSFSSVYIYKSTVAGSYSIDPIDALIRTSKSPLITGLQRNATTYFKFIPIGEVGTAGYTISDISVNTYSYLSKIYASAIYDTSAVFTFDGSFTLMDICYNDFYNNTQLTYYAGGTTNLDVSSLMPNYTYVVTSDSVNFMGQVTAGNTITFTTLPKIYSWSVQMIDSSSVALTWDGSFASVNIYSTVSMGSYTGAARSYTGKSGVFNGVSANTSNYFKIVPVGTYGALGYGIMDISAITMSKITKMAAAAVWDTSAVIVFDGSFTYLDICYNDFYNTVQLTYYKTRTTGTDISGLLPNYTYTLTTDSVGVLNLTTAGNTVVFTTLPKIYSFVAAPIDSSSAMITWDGSFASVNLYTSTTKSTYSGTSYSFTGKTAILNGLSPNTTNYFKVVPVGTYGALGYGVMDISVITFSKLTKMTASAVWDTSAVIVFDGSFSAVDICYNDFYKNVQLAYRFPTKTTGTDISGLLPNYTYTITTDSINPYGVVSAGNTIVITTLPKIYTFNVLSIDSSSVILTWDGSFASVNIYQSTTKSSYTGNLVSYSNTTTTATMNGLTNPNTRYYFKIVPVGTYGALGYGVMDISAVTYSVQTKMAASAVWDTSATIYFDGSYSLVDICYGSVWLKYSTRATTTGRDISGLTPNTTYVITTDSINSVGQITAGNTITFTTLPKMTYMTASAIDVSTITITWDGSFSSVNIYSSTTAGSYTGSYTNYDSSIKTTTYTGINANARNYYKFVPVGTYGALGYGIMDISAIYTVDFSNLNIFTVTLLNLSNSTPITTSVGITSFKTTALDVSSILVSWDGSYSTVTLYNYTTYGSYTSGSSTTYTNYSTKSKLFTGLAKNTTYYYAITCYGSGVYGKPIYDFSGATFPTLTKMALVSSTDVSAIIAFDGSFAAVDICYNTTQLVYYTRAPQGVTISDLWSNYNYVMTTDARNPTGKFIGGNTITFTTWPKITSVTASATDSSSITVTWDGSFASVDLYQSSTSGTYVDSAQSYSATTKSAVFSDLSYNTAYYFKIVPVGTYGANGYSKTDISTVTRSIESSLAVSSVYDVSALITFSGIYSAIDICYSNVWLKYTTSSGDTGTDISGLTPNTTYTVTTDTKNSSGLITSGSSVTFTTLPQVSNFVASTIDSSTVSLSFDGYYTSVNVYSDNNFASYTNYTAGSPIQINGLDSNTEYYFAIQPVGSSGSLGSLLSDVSAITLSKVTSFTATSIDISSIELTWDGSYSGVNIYMESENVYNSNSQSILINSSNVVVSTSDSTTKSALIDGLTADNMYYFRIVPYGANGDNGTSVYANADTYSYVFYVSASGITDSSATLIFDGSYDEIRFEYITNESDYDVSYGSGYGTVTLENLQANYTYTVTTTSVNSELQTTIYGNIIFNTLPNIRNFAASIVDSSSISIAWDGSYASVDVYVSTTEGTYSGSATNYTSSFAVIDNLIPNTKYYFKAQPVGTYGDYGTAIADVSTETAPYLDSFTASIVDSSYVKLVWDGSYGSVDIYTSTTQSSYTDSPTNYTTSYALLQDLNYNTIYYFKARPTGTYGDYGTAIADISAIMYSTIDENFSVLSFT